METSPTKHITLKKLRTESKRVLKSQRHVFVRLSLLFLLPLSLVIVLFQTLTPIIIPKETNPNDHTYFSKINILLAFGAYIITTLIFSVSATASITFTAFHGFIDEPIKFKSAIKSIKASFFPLLATILLFQAIIFIITFLFILVAGLFIGALAVLGLVSITASKYFVIFIAVLFIAIVMYLQVNWFFVNSVVVVESKWGFEALKRSKALIHGNKRFAWFVILVFGVFNLIFLWSNSGTGSIRTTLIDGTDSVDAKYLIMSVIIILIKSCLITMTQLYSLIIATVLYALCKESHGGEEYFSLLVNDEKIASVV